MRARVLSMKTRTLINQLIFRCRTPVIWVALSLVSATARAEQAKVPQEEHLLLSDWLSSDGVTGNWDGWRTDLNNRGVDFFGNYQAEIWNNATGGLAQGTVYTGLLKFGLNLDLQKATGWCGASLSTSWLWLSGRDPSKELVGNILTISGDAGLPALRMFELWFQQNLWDDKISLRLGQLSADTEFVISKYAATFINSSLGWPAFMYENLPGGGPAFPMGTLGIRLSLNPVDWLKFQTAVFQGNVYAQNVNLHGFRWRLDSQNGLFFINEAQFLWNQSGQQPGELKAGGWLDTAEFVEPNDDRLVRGNYGFYFIVDQMLCPKPAKLSQDPAAALKDGKSSLSAPDGNKAAPAVQQPDQGLGWFGRLAFEPNDHDFVGFYFDTGLTYKGLIPTRDEDTLGVAFAYAKLSSGAPQPSINESVGGLGAEMAFEATYLTQITKWLNIQPDLQVIINPGGNKGLSNALVVGGRLSITF
jgi:porin